MTSRFKITVVISFISFVNAQAVVFWIRKLP